MKNNIGVQGCFGEDDGGRSMVSRIGSSTIASYHPINIKKKTYGLFFGKRQLMLSTSSLLFQESPS